MAEVRKTQERFFRRPPWMAEVRKTQERFSGHALTQVESVYPENGV
jgi:hypothetical protein